jgi:putative transposase
VSYGYSKTGAQKRQEQTVKTDGNRVSILGLWQPGKQFEYALAQCGFNSNSYIKVLNWIADKAATTLAATGKITVIVHGNNLYLLQTFALKPSEIIDLPIDRKASDK